MRRMQYALILLVTAAASAQAQRADTLRMSCDQARSIVARDGAVVLASGPQIYDRYVSSSRFCAYGEVARPAFTQTRDAPACMVGSVCKTPDQIRPFETD